MTATLDDFLGKCDVFACRVLRKNEYTDWLTRSSLKDFSLFVHCQMVNCHEQFWFNLEGDTCDICLKYICDECRDDNPDVIRGVNRIGKRSSYCICKSHTEGIIGDRIIVNKNI
jgi:hypothetical protein